ncbi:MAG: PEP-utilizing enzyme [Candidatus Veblenbacteria bacterium]|nr:PEP-utilizing enzyme [Candidatus Veblenbacteria bacterium]
MNKKSRKPLWMNAADIPDNTLFMMSVAMNFFMKHWSRYGMKVYETRYFTLFRGTFATMHYLRSEFDRQADSLAGQIVGNHQWGIRLLRRIQAWSTQFMVRAKGIAKVKLEGLTNAQLLRLYRRVLRYHILSHGVGFSINWHADAEGERVTKSLWVELEAHLKRAGSARNPAAVFSLLTTPQRLSLVAQEELDLLRLAARMYSRPVRHRFTRTALEPLTVWVEQSKYPIARAIRRHHQHYCWLDYQYRGPAAPLSVYVARLKELCRGKQNPAALRLKLMAERRTTVREQNRLARELKLPRTFIYKLTLARELVFTKAYRKEALYHGMYCYEPFFQEVGRRLGLSLAQVWAMNWWEIEEALRGNSPSIHELNERQQLAVAYVDKYGYRVYTGNSAERFLRGVRFERRYNVAARELRGTPACPGVVRGTVRIVNVPSDMHKMRTGDILVAHNTNPNLVPAMKKAAALVCEAGGLTCHTAIVARELKTPCVVGVPGVDKILKDGDRVEVDADKGIIRKL